MKYYLIILATIALAVFTACSSGQKALERGDYNGAAKKAINRLRSNPDHSKASKTLKKAYQLAVNLSLDNVSRAEAGNAPMKWETIYFNYAQINALYDEIQRCPGCLEVVPSPARYDQELNNARGKAAEVRYDLGKRALTDKRDRRKALEAHQHFSKVKEFGGAYSDIDQMLDEALFYATLKVLVEPIPVPARNMEIRHEFFVNKINEYLHSERINRYVRFYTPQEAERDQLEFVHHVIRMQFDDFVIGQVATHTLERKVSRDSVEVGTVEGKPVLGTVKATLIVHEKSVRSAGVLDFKIVDDYLGKVVTQEKFPEEHIWVSQWAGFNGDERALNKEEIALVRQSESAVPGPQLMFEEFTVPIHTQVIAKIRSFYRNY